MLLLIDNGTLAALVDLTVVGLAAAQVYAFFHLPRVLGFFVGHRAAGLRSGRELGVDPGKL